MILTEQNIRLDIPFCRSHFPAFANGWTYLDNAGGSLVPRGVISRMSAFLAECRNQPYEHHGPGKLANDRLIETYSAIAQLINAESDEIAIGPSTSANIYVLSQAFRKSLSAGDEVVVTNQDHEANIGVWRRLSEVGVKVVEWRVDPESGLLALDDLSAIISARTKLVCVTHASNIVSAINPIPEIVAMAHKAGARVCVDGVAFAPHAAIDVKALGADFYFFSLYKLYGPHLGVLFGKRDEIRKLENQNLFFYNGHGARTLHPSGDQYEAVAAAAGTLDYLDSVYDHHFGDGEPDLRTRASRVFDLFKASETVTGTRFIDYLSRKQNVRLLGHRTGDRARRMPTVAFKVANRRSKDIVTNLASHRIAAAFGNFYSVRCLEALGLSDLSDGVVRVSFVHYNSPQDVECLIAALEPDLA